MSYTTTNQLLRDRKTNTCLPYKNLTLDKFIKMQEFSNESKLFLKQDNNNNIISPFENKKMNSIENNNDSNTNNNNNISSNKKYGLIELISIYNSIISKLDSLLNSYNKNSFQYIYSCLSKIKNNISKIIGEKTIIKNISRNNNNISEIKKYRYKTTQIDIKKYNSFNKKNKRKILFSALPSNKNKGFKQNNTSIQKNNDLNESKLGREYQDINLRKIKFLRQKYNDLENKYKIEELNYLFRIGEQQKKIIQLEKEINMINVDNMSKEELKKYRCFPNYVKFDVIDDSYQKPNNLRKTMLRNKCHSSFQQRRHITNNFFEEKNNNNLNNSRNDNDNLLNNQNDDNKNKTINVIKDYNNKNNNNDDELFKQTKEIIEYGKKNFNKEDFFIKKFFDQKKNYFISHPKLNYIKYGTDGLNMKTWKINDMLETLPKKISKYKFSSKSQKNAIIVFPSSLNETVVNLEKLRVNKNFRSIEIKFEENRKKNKQKNINNEM